MIIVPSEIFCQNAYSIKTGTLSCGGHFSLKSKSNDDYGESYNILNLYSQFDVFVSKNISAGLLINYFKEWQGQWNQREFGFGPNIRYYFDYQSTKPFLGAGYLYFSETWSSMNYDRSEENILFNGGIAIFLSDIVALEPMVNYKLTKEKFNDKIDDGWLFTNNKKERSGVTFEFVFGIRIFFKEIFN